MLSFALKILGWLLSAFTGRGPSQEAQEAAKAASATTEAQGADNALSEIKNADDARAAAERDSVRAAGTGTITSDPSASINQVDSEDRRD